MASVFRPFSMTEAGRTARREQRDLVRATMEQLQPLRKRIAAGEPLTEADQRVLAMAGPRTREWLARS